MNSVDTDQEFLGYGRRITLLNIRDTISFINAIGIETIEPTVYSASRSSLLVITAKVERLDHTLKRFTSLNKLDDKFTDADQKLLEELKKSDDITDQYIVYIVLNWHKGTPYEELMDALTTAMMNYIKTMRKFTIQDYYILPANDEEAKSIINRSEANNNGRITAESAKMILDTREATFTFLSAKFNCVSISITGQLEVRDDNATLRYLLSLTRSDQEIEIVRDYASGCVWGETTWVDNFIVGMFGTA